MDLVAILRLILLLAPIILKWIEEANGNEEREEREATAKAIFEMIGIA